MFTRPSNFTYGNYKIANIVADSLDNSLELLVHIQKYEQASLRLCLGDSTYEEFINKLEPDANGFYKLKEDAEEKWGWLLDGHSYLPSQNHKHYNCGCLPDQNVRWSGLVKKVATVKEIYVYESMMASYIFYYWSLDHRTLNLGTGEGRIESKAAIPESSKNKRIDAWNEFIQWAHYGYSCTNVSLSRFLEDHKAEFPNVNEIDFKPLTYYDL